MFAIDRGVTSCKHATKFCRQHCYNNKFYRMGSHLQKRDVKNDLYWNQLDGESLKKELARKKNPTKRFRLCTRGEPFSSEKDIYKIKDWAENNKGTKFEAPTRAWRNKKLKALIEKELFGVGNLYIHASLDPSNTQKEAAAICSAGWSTSFFGSNEEYPFDLKYTKCPQKWGDKNIACSKCNLACFTHKQTHHWLKEH